MKKILMILFLCISVYASKDIRRVGVVEVFQRENGLYGKPTELVLSVINDVQYEYYYIRKKGNGLLLFDCIGMTIKVYGKTWKAYYGEDIMNYLYVNKFDILKKK